jgi:hypothetical protein
MARIAPSSRLEITANLGLPNRALFTQASIAAGVARLPDIRTGLAATQAAWRTLNNKTVGIPALIAPLSKEGLSAARRSKPKCPIGARLVQIKFRSPSMQSRHPINHPRHGRGIRIEHGALGQWIRWPFLGAVGDGTKTATGVLSTRRSTPRGRPHLEQVLPTMTASGEWGLNQPILNVIDREADSVGHYPRWNYGTLFFRTRLSFVSCTNTSNSSFETSIPTHTFC